MRKTSAAKAEKPPSEYHRSCQHDEMEAVIVPMNERNSQNVQGSMPGMMSGAGVRTPRLTSAPPPGPLSGASAFISAISAASGVSAPPRRTAVAPTVVATQAPQTATQSRSPASCATSSARCRPAGCRRVSRLANRAGQDSADARSGGLAASRRRAWMQVALAIWDWLTVRGTPSPPNC